jgi:chemotaxis protein MotA
MDVATILGLTLAWSMIVLSVVLSGGSMNAFWNTASVCMVLGGTAGAVLIGFPTRTVARTPKVMLKGLFPRSPDPRLLIKAIVGLSETARREGLLALENRLESIENRFLRLGVQLAIDGNRAEMIEDVMRSEVNAMATRHKEGRAVIDRVGKYAPAFGMIGTLLGLIVMLGNMADPSSIGGGMAVALITTLYGALLANASFLPISEKLAYLSKQEMIGREIAIRGILAIQSGENPRVIEQKLSTFLPPHLRSREYR